MCVCVCVCVCVRVCVCVYGWVALFRNELVVVVLNTNDSQSIDFQLQVDASYTLV